MTDAEKLEALVRRAIENGWRPPLEDNFTSWRVTEENQDTEEHRVYVLNPYVHFEMEGDVDWQQDCLVLCYSHDFAKALFGDEDAHKLKELLIIPDSCDGDCYAQAHFSGKVFQYHLQQAVIADNAIEYMYKEVFGGL